MEPDPKEEEWRREREKFGWLGQPPAVVLSAPPRIAKEWKKLAQRARAVALMRYSARKVEKAKEIEARRNTIIEMAQAAMRGSNEQPKESG